MTQSHLKFVPKVLLSSLILCAGFYSFQATATAERLARQNQYPQGAKEEYLAACQQSSQQQGLDQTQAQAVCECTLEQFQTRYTLEQFEQLFSQAKTSDEPPDELIQVGLSCAAQLSQEQ